MNDNHPQDVSRDIFTTPLAYTIHREKYSMNGTETWEDTARRVVDAVCGELISGEEKEEIFQLILTRKFIPGGRYLFAAGREYHQVNNCFLYRVEDSREGWAELQYKAAMGLMSGGGIGVDYSALREEGAIIRRTGGRSTGPIALMKAVNEAGRQYVNGGNRRSAIWAGLSWSHPDVFKFLALKNHPEEWKKLKERDLTFPLPMELTNISVIYDKSFFDAYDGGDERAKELWRQNCRQAFSTAEPGFAFNFRNARDSLRNAPVSADTWILTRSGYQQVSEVIDRKVEVWTGKRYAETVFKKTKSSVKTLLIKMTGNRVIKADPTHEFKVENWIGAGKKNRRLESIESVPASELEEGDILHVSLPCPDVVGLDKEAYTLGFTKMLRGDLSGLTLTAAQLPSFIAGLFDADGNCVEELSRLRLGSSDFNILCVVRRYLEQLGIMAHVSKNGSSGYTGESGQWQLVVAASSVNRFVEVIPTVRVCGRPHTPYRRSTIKVLSVEEGPIEDVYCCDVGVEEHSFCAEGVIISNCTEVTSEDDSDKCNLGTLWMAKHSSLDDFANSVRLATLFLLCGGIYSDVPTAKIREVGGLNNRIGLGLGGMHEWLMLRKENYEVTPEMHDWLRIYRDVSDQSAEIFSSRLGVNLPKGKRAIAPTGTISIIAESTSGIEPLFCAAYKRRYFKDGQWNYQYVVDGSVKRLLAAGVPLEVIEQNDAYALDFEQRVKFQADVQDYVDMAISSTCNMPEWGSYHNNEGNVEEKAKILYSYGPRLRGFTCYPDGCRGGQPLTKVSVKKAQEQEGMIFLEEVRECTNGVCGL